MEQLPTIATIEEAQNGYVVRGYGMPSICSTWQEAVATLEAIFAEDK